MFFTLLLKYKLDKNTKNNVHNTHHVIFQYMLVLMAFIRTKKWIVALFNDILTSGKIPKLFKCSKLITIFKPGKDGSDPWHFRPISLLSIVFKILERLILQRIQPLIDAVVPVSLAGIRKNHSCTEEVLALTSHMIKTGVVFIDLTAAYDTVCRDGLVLKFMLVVPCAKLTKLLNNMLSNRFFQVFLSDKSSRWRRLNNGLRPTTLICRRQRKKLLLALTWCGN
jgi:hypothetical protein